jgi:ligand-binding sensor domain-containing protein
MDTDGNPIGCHINAIIRDNQGALWVATDGEGIWRLQDGAWEQFVNDGTPATKNMPHQATYTVVAHEGTIWVGTIAGIVRYNGFTWSKSAVAELRRVHSIDFASNGDMWLGFIETEPTFAGGVRLVRADGSIVDFGPETHGLSSGKVRSLVVDDLDRPWVATWGGGVNVFEYGSWRPIRAGPDALPSDNVSAVVVDRHGRIWAGTDKGVAFLGDNKWVVYSDWDTFSIGVGATGRERCSFDDVHLWTGTNGVGLTHSRLPAASAVITDIDVDGIPEQLAPGDSFSPAVIVTFEADYSLTTGDFLRSIDQASFTAHPFIAPPPGTEVRGGQSFTFSFEHNPMTAPDKPGEYRSTWRLWQCGRYVGPPIVIGFEVIADSR